MSALELKVPPPVVAIVAALAMWGIARLSPDPGRPAIAVGLALALAAAGVACSVAGAMAFRKAMTTKNPMKPQAASSLVVAGVYRLTRNPMYLGLLLVLLGWTVFLGSGWALAGPVAFVAYISRFQIAPEERALATLFGSQYSAYRTRVRRWL